MVEKKTNKLQALVQTNGTQFEKAQLSNTIKIEKKETDKEKTKLLAKATYYFNKDNLERFKAISYYERKGISELLDEAISNYISNYSDLEKAISVFKRK